jgi:hypothetical protein
MHMASGVKHFIPQGVPSLPIDAARANTAQDTADLADALAVAKSKLAEVQALHDSIVAALSPVGAASPAARKTLVHTVKMKGVRGW